jgi:DNA-binding NarL/FixJ family response regulator
MPTSVFVADDDPLTRYALRNAISSHVALELVGEAADGLAAAAEITRLRPEVALLDLRMPGLSGLEVITLLGQRRVSTRLVVLTGTDTGHAIRDCMAAGVAGYLVKGTEIDVICEALTRAAAGEQLPLSAPLQRALIAQIREASSVNGAGLTPRERAVLGLVARGRSNAEVALELSLGLSTVKAHLRNAYGKLGVDNRPAAVLAAERLGLL